MTLHGPTRWCCALAGVFLGAGAPAHGQAVQEQPAQEPPGAEQPPPEPSRPRSAERVVHVFDFEEQLTNPLDIPEGWVRAQHDERLGRTRPDYPVWNRARLDYKVAARGGGSVRLAVAGGNASLRLEPGVLPVFPLGQYEVTALVRTTDLSLARPRLVVRALDAMSVPIEGSERSALLEEAGEGWHRLTVVLPGLFADAAFLQIDLEVVQPRTYEEPRLAEHQVWDADFDGAAWFDDVVVMQMPQVAMRSQSPLGVIARPERPGLKVEIRDLTAEDMTATLRIYDARRRLVDTATRAITVGRSAWVWEPGLTELGWYRAMVDVAAGERLIASTACDLVWVEGGRAGTPEYGSGPSFSGLETAASGASWRPFVIELTRLPPGTAQELAGGVRGLGVDTVALPVWEEGLERSALGARVEGLRADLAALRDGWIDAELSLSGVPGGLAGAMGVRGDDVVGALNGGEASWGPFLLDALDKLGDTNSRWLLGASGSTALDGRAGPADELAGARRALGKFVPGVEVGIGWRADLGAGPALAVGADDVYVELPSWLGCAPMDILVRPWLSADGPAPTFVLEPLSGGEFAERDSAADVVRRTVELWRAATGEGSAGFRVGLRDPWVIEEGGEGRADPTPACAAWRALADRLSGRGFACDWAVGEGVRCMLFVPPASDPERGGLIAAWTETASPEDAEIIAALAGDAVRVYDIFGNERRVAPNSSEDGARQEHHIRLGAEPVFVEGIDTELVLFLASIGLDPPLIQSVAGEHEHAVRLRNPWPGPITGRVIVTEPGGYVGGEEARDRSWEISPRTMSFDLAAGAEARLPLVISFSRSTEAGRKDFVFDVHIIGEKDYGWVRARSFAELAWNDVAMELNLRPAAPGSGADLIVEATITNEGEQTRSFDAVAYATGMPRVRSSVGSLRPGETVVRRFPFEKAYDALGGGRVMVSLSEPDGPGRLTRSIEIPRR